ncbi:MAG: hypothetical protein AAGA38_17525 [Pseudomonadota bacterium]
MKGLLFLAPILSSALSLIAYLAGAGLWVVIAAFFLAGPLLVLVVGLFLDRSTNDDGDPK